MRIAALSDIHGNVFALQAVLDDVQRRGVDLIVNLGDIFYGPIAPRATFDLLVGREISTILGNQDRQLYQADGTEIAANPTLQFVLTDLGPEPLDWLRSLPADEQLDGGIHLCHGTPTGDTEYLLEDVATGRARLRSDEDIIARLAGNTARLVVCGHTHLARTVALSSGQLVVNPGSVGLPAYTDDAPVAHTMETCLPHAAYAILEDGARGWTVQQVKVAYDHQQAARAAIENGRPDWARFLTTGRG